MGGGSLWALSTLGDDDTDGREIPSVEGAVDEEDTKTGEPSLSPPRRGATTREDHETCGTMRDEDCSFVTLSLGVLFAGSETGRDHDTRPKELRWGETRCEAYLPLGDDSLWALSTLGDDDTEGREIPSVEGEVDEEDTKTGEPSLPPPRRGATTREDHETCGTIRDEDCSFVPLSLDVLFAGSETGRDHGTRETI